jgi:hypothetical protein
VSQEWDEVVNEVKLMIERLDAFEDDLKAAADSGKLTGKQRDGAMYIALLSSAASLCLLNELETAVTSETAKEGDTQE